MLTLLGFLREYVEQEVASFARRNPGVVIYVNARPCCVPRVVAEYREWGRAVAGKRPEGVLGPPPLTSDLSASYYPHLPPAS